MLPRRPRTLTRQVALLTGGISTAVILFTGIVFSLAYFLFVQHDMHSLLVKQASEILSQQVSYTNDQITFRQDSAAEALSTKLGNYNLSAIVFDHRLVTVGVFGVYQNPVLTQRLSSYINRTSINQALTSNESSFATHILPGNITYETFITPIKHDQRTVGVLLLSRQSDFINHLLELNLVILAFSLPLSIIFGWILSVTTIKQSFTPLNSLLAYLRHLEYSSPLSSIQLPQDVPTEVAQLATAFNDMMARVGDSLTKQKEFVAHASHELKTPLTAAISSLELATNSPDQSVVHQHILQVKQDLLDLNHILDSLLVMSKISAPQTPPSPASPLHLPRLIPQLVTTFQGAIESKRLTVTTSFNSSSPLHFPAEHFRILFTNLLSNAIKYNRPGGSISISWSGSTLTVSDTGLGMSVEETRHMFDRFYRGRTSASHTQGTGLGLALVKLIADTHHLVLQVSSRPRRGTTISVTFPL